MKTREQKTRLTLSLAIAVAFSAAGLLATNTQVPMGDDRTIVSDIRDKLRRDPSLGHIGVECLNGVVTLSGTVKSPTEESRAIGIASGEPGVTNVISQLTIKHKKAQHAASQETTKATKTKKTTKTTNTQ
jgi:hypothetical protein